MYGPEITNKLPYFGGLKITLYQGAAGAVLLCSSVLHTLHARKPVRANIVKHLAAAAVGYYVGGQVEKLIEDRRNLRVRVIEDYIALHPEDFPVTEPKKYKDLLMKWYPVR